MPVNSTAIGAVQIGENDCAVIILQFGMHPADSLVVELDVVFFLTTNCDGSLQIAMDTSTLSPFQYG